MSGVYIIWQVATGRIVNRMDWTDAGPLPPEGPLPGDTDYAILHADADPETHHVVDFEAVPIAAADLEAQANERKMREFRALRNHKLTASDWAVLPDSPIDEEQRAEIQAKRQATRDIPQNTNDPEEAMRLLNEIWSET